MEWIIKIQLIFYLCFIERTAYDYKIAEVTFDSNSGIPLSTDIEKCISGILEVERWLVVDCFTPNKKTVQIDFGIARAAIPRESHVTPVVGRHDGPVKIERDKQKVTQVKQEKQGDAIAEEAKQVNQVRQATQIRGGKKRINRKNVPVENGGSLTGFRAGYHLKVT